MKNQPSNNFRKTRHLGLIPADWTSGRIGDLIAHLDAGVSVNSEDRQKRNGEIGVLKVSAVSYGCFNPDAHKCVIQDEINLAKETPNKGLIIVSRSNTPDLVGASAYIEEDHPDLFLPDKLWQLKPIGKKKTDMLWLAYVLASAPARYRLSRLATGTSGSMKNISKDDLKSLPIAIPPFAEQKTIANTLRLWDQTITPIESLISAKQNRRKALMQQLLTGQRRFPGFQNDWPEMKLSEFLAESRIPGGHGRTAKKITVKLYGLGVYAKEEKRSGSENTKYYTRSAGQFIYSKLDFLNGAFGLIPESLDGYETTLDLPCFDISESLEPKFLLYYISREAFYTRFLGSAMGGRKARRVNPTEFLAIRIKVPPLGEQKRIVQAIELADREIQLIEQQLEALKKQKTGLMQQLLTGRRRVKITEDAA